MNQELFNERIKQLANAEIAAKQWGWWYLSFAGEEGFRGAIYIQGYGLTTALLRVHALKLSPGGEVMGIPLPPDVQPPPLAYCNRLLNKEELLKLDPEMKTLGELERE